MDKNQESVNLLSMFEPSDENQDVTYNPMHKKN